MDWSAELEAAIREDPDDDAAWMVLEDWTVERGGPRGRIVELDKSGYTGAAHSMNYEFHLALLGDRARTLMPALFHSRWRAGYLMDIDLRVPPRDRFASVAAALLNEVLALRVAAVVRSIAVELNGAEIAATCRTLAQVPWLRGFTMRGGFGGGASFDPTVLEPLAVTRLAIFDRSIELPVHPVLARLRALTFIASNPDDVRRLFEDAATLNSLEELGLGVARFGDNHAFMRELLEPLCSGVAAPALRRLDLDVAIDDNHETLLDGLARGPMLPRLERLTFRGAPLAPDKIPPRLRGAFGHVARSSDR